jgi:hypothetical protein
MLSILAIAGSLFFAWDYYYQAKRSGEWSWRKFFAILGAVAIFAAGYIYPLAVEAVTASDPTMPLVFLIAGIFVFVIVIAIVFRKRKRPSA